MKNHIINKLCCPFDKNDLQIHIVSGDGDEIMEGLLTCENCSRSFPIVYGIPIMSPDEYRDKELEKPLMERLSKKLKQREMNLLN